MATPSIAAPATNSLDVPSLVSQLMSVERRPIDKLNTKISNYQTRISSYGTLSGLVSGFQTALQGLNKSLLGMSATPSDASFFSASAASTAAAGTYSLEVTHLAQSQNLVAAGQVSDTSAIASVASTATFTIGTTNTDVQIAAGATLQDIRTAINSANLGVTATIVNDGSGTPYRLALTSNATGASNGISHITIQAGGDPDINNLLAYNPTPGNPPTLPTMTQTIAAQDSAFTVNGIAITSASNTITEAIQGVTLTLNKLTITPVTLTVVHDTNAASSAASGFVDAYNALASQLKSRSAYGNATTPGGSLAGDGTLRLMQDQLRGIFNTVASGGTLASLSQVGISTQADGTLKLDSSKFNNALTNNFADVTNLFSSATGFATRLVAWTKSVLSSGDGLIAARTKNLNDSIKDYNAQISRLEARMTALQKQYTTTYSNLNILLNNMSSTSSYLSQQLSRGA